MVVLRAELVAGAGGGAGVSVDRRLILPGLEGVDLMFRLRSGMIAGEAEKIVLGDQIYFLTPSQMNDRHEARPAITFSNGGRIPPRRVRELVDRQRPDLSYTDRRELAQRLVARNDFNEIRQWSMRLYQEWMRTLGQNSSFCSFFTEDSDRNWAHYGGLQKGFGVVFDRLATFRIDLADAQGRIYDDGRGAEMAAEPVKYVPIDEYPTIDMDTDWRDGAQNALMIDAIFFTKSKDWEHEREYRPVRPGILNSYQPFDPAQLRALIVTDLTPPALVDELKLLVAQRHLPLPIFMRKPGDGTYVPSYARIA